MSAEAGERAVLAPATPLAVVDIAMSSPSAPTAAAYWAAELGYSSTDAPPGEIRDEHSLLLERWAEGRVGLAVCRLDTATSAQPWRSDPSRFSETWLGTTRASDALSALRWVIAGFAGGRFERALLGAISDSGGGATSETWLVLMPLAEARAAGSPVLAIWGPQPAAHAIGLVTTALADRTQIEPVLAALLPAEPTRLPVRALWSPRADGGTDAQSVFSICATAALAIAYRALPASRAVGDWPGPRERGFGRFPRPRPWLLEPGRAPRTALALIPGEPKGIALPFSDADPESTDPRTLPWPVQLYVLSAPSAAGLQAEIDLLRHRLAAGPAGPGMLASALLAKPRHRHRCAIVARGAADLARKLEIAAARLRGAVAAPTPRERVFLGASESVGASIAFVIPGQGPQYAGMLRELALLSPDARRAFERLASAFAEEGTSLTPLLHPAQDVIGADFGREVEGFWRDVGGGGLVGSAGCQALLEFLAVFNVRPIMLLGHSIGETTALALAEGLGPAPPEQVAGMARSFAALRAELLRLRRLANDAGIAVSGADRARVERALEARAGRAFLALDNCPHQVVLLGEHQAIAEISTELRAEGAACLDVSLGAPFHTPLFERAIGGMAAFYDRLGVRAPRIPVWSGARNAPFPPDPAEIKALLLRQWTETVRFVASVRALYDRDVRIFVEVGPGDTLTGFIDDILGDREHLAIACDSPWFGGLEHLLAALGRLFVAGVGVGSGAQAVAPPSPRLDAAALRAGHAALMETLEASRTRVKALVAARPTLGLRPPPAQGSMFPALGPRRDMDDGAIAFERRLTLESDPYLGDHVFGSIRSPRARDLVALPVMPGVMTLEILAQGGLATASPDRRASVAAVERLRLHRWLTLDRGFLDLRVVARPSRSDRHKVDVELFELDAAAPAGRWTVADATVVVEPELPRPPSGRRLAGQTIEPSLSRERFIAEYIFQGPSLRCFIRPLRITDQGIEAEVVVPPRDRLYRGETAPRLATGANLIDGAGQTVAHWLVEKWSGWDSVYPFYAGGYAQFGPLPRPGERLRCVAFITDDGQSATADVEFQRSDGSVACAYRDFRQRRFALTAELAACVRNYDADYVFTRPFAAGPGLAGRLFDGAYHDVVRPERAIFLQSVAHSVLTATEREAWCAIPQGSPRRAGWLMGRVAAKEAVCAWAAERHGLSLSPIDIEIAADERGKPIARFIGHEAAISPPDISISHVDTLALAVVAEDVSVGVDVEQEREGKPRTVPEMAFAEGELAEATRTGTPPIALWCAKEAAAKALGVGLLGEPRRWRVEDLAPDGRAVVVTIDGLRVHVALQSQGRGVVAVAQVARALAAEARERLRAGG